MKKLLVIAFLFLSVSISHADAIKNGVLRRYSKPQNKIGVSDVYRVPSYASAWSNDGTYLYGKSSDSKNVTRMDANLTITTSALDFSTLTTPNGGAPSIRSVHATATPGLIFVEASDASKYYIYKSIDYGDHVGSNSPTFDNGQPVLWLGDVDGNVAHQITSVMILTNQAFCEATIGGSRKLIIGEYNINDTRADGWTNDQVRLMQSDDDGTTWSVLSKWNTANGNQVRHIHAVQQNPYNSKVYVAFGDADTSCGIVQWDGAGTWVDNTPLPNYNSITGFKSVTGSQIYRVCGFAFFPDFVITGSDSSTYAKTRGIWVFNEDFEYFKLDDFAIRNHNRQVFFLMHKETGTNRAIVSSYVETSGTDKYIRIYGTSDATLRWNWDLLGTIRVGASTTSAYTLMKINQIGDYIYVFWTDGQLTGFGGNVIRFKLTDGNTRPVVFY